MQDSNPTFQTEPGARPKAAPAGGVRKSMASASLPAISATEGGLSRYLAEIRRFPMLEPEEEFLLAKAWRDRGDIASAHQMVTSHLSLVAKNDMGYRGYGVPAGARIPEANGGRR